VLHRSFYTGILGLALMVSASALAGAQKFTWEFSGATDPKAPTVVLLHGLNRSSRSMRTLAKALAGEGYRVVNIDYPSDRYTIEELGRRLGQALQRCCSPAPAAGFNFVTHSLGGIVVRAYASMIQPAKNKKFPIARVVMLGPPNHGSELTDKLRNNPFYELLTGPAGQQLGTEPGSVPNRLGPVPFELGVIAGSASLNPLYSMLIPGPDDGKVAVSNARVAGLKDFIVVDASHSFLVNNATVIRQSLLFLRQGNFDHPSTKPVPE